MSVRKKINIKLCEAYQPSTVFLNNHIPKSRKAFSEQSHPCTKQPNKVSFSSPHNNLQWLLCNLQFYNSDTHVILKTVVAHTSFTVYKRSRPSCTYHSQKQHTPQTFTHRKINTDVNHHQPQAIMQLPEKKHLTVPPPPTPTP